MLLILVLARLFCPSLAEEELRGVKQKNTLMGRGILCVMIPFFTINNKSKEKAIPKTHTQVP